MIWLLLIIAIGLATAILAVAPLVGGWHILYLLGTRLACLFCTWHLLGEEGAKAGLRIKMFATLGLFIILPFIDLIFFPLAP